MRKILVVVTMMLSTVAGAVGLGAGSASAGAYGCSLWGNKTVANVTVFSGQYCAEIVGSGTYVDSVSGGFTSAGNVCNWNITAEFFDSNGRWYQTVTGSTQWGCKRIATAPRLMIRQNVQKGFMCSTLKSNGGRITSVCHNIF